MSSAEIIYAEMSPFLSRSVAFSTSEKASAYLPPYHKIAIQYNRSTLPDWSDPETIEVLVVEEHDGEVSFQLSWFQNRNEPSARYIPRNYALPLAALQATIWARHHQLKSWDANGSSPRRRDNMLYVERAAMVTVWEDFKRRLPKNSRQLREWVHVPLAVWWMMTKHNHSFSQSGFMAFMSSRHASRVFSPGGFDLESPRSEAVYVYENCANLLRFSVGPLDRRFGSTGYYSKTDYAHAKHIVVTERALAEAALVWDTIPTVGHSPTGWWQISINHLNAFVNWNAVTEPMPQMFRDEYIRLLRLVCREGMQICAPYGAPVGELITTVYYVSKIKLNEDQYEDQYEDQFFHMVLHWEVGSNNITVHTFCKGKYLNEWESYARTCVRKLIVSTSAISGCRAILKSAALAHAPVETYGASINMEDMHMLQFLAGRIFGCTPYLTEQRMEAAKWAMFLELYTGRLRIRMNQ